MPDEAETRRFGGVARLFGPAALQRLAASHVVVVGIGGVGSWAAEALARSGVGALTLIDMDHISESNVNRQIHALESTLGAAKVAVMATRIADISPQCRVRVIDDFVTEDNVVGLLAEPSDCVIDAIDQPRAKAALIAHCRSRQCAVVVCGAAGGRIDPLALQAADLALTRGDALLASVRARLRRDYGFAREAGSRFGVTAIFADTPRGAARPSADSGAGAALACSGYGSLVAVTATMGFAAAQRAMTRYFAPVPIERESSEVKALLRRLSGAKGDELAACLWSFLYFYCLLAGYYVLRPIRDEMAIQVGRDQLAELFTYVFVAMLVMVPVFGWLTSRFPRRTMLPCLYGFCVVNLLGFCLVMASAGQQSATVARAFYVWLSVYNLFAISVFWSLMADIFDTEQAHRLYGFIAAGGTAGALTGPLITASLVAVLGAKLLMAVSAAFLMGAILAIVKLSAWSRQHPNRQPNLLSAPADRAIGGSIWAGLADVIRSPYLLGICFFLFCYALLSTFLYFQQVELLPLAISDSAERTRLLALLDLAVNIGTLLLQLLAFGALIQRLGITSLLIAMPLLSVVGFAAMALSPVLVTLLIFGALRRAGEYAISKPARETLFNVLPAEQKYKAKNVIDTLVHRGGDTSSSWIMNGLKTFKLSLVDLSWLSAAIALLWLASAVGLGWQARRLMSRHPH